MSYTARPRSLAQGLLGKREPRIAPVQSTGKLKPERYNNFNHGYTGESQPRNHSMMIESEKGRSRPQLNTLEDILRLELEEQKRKYRQIMQENDKLHIKATELENENIELKTEKVDLMEQVKKEQTKYQALKMDYDKKSTQINVKAYLISKFKNRPSKKDLEKKNILKDESCFNTFIDRVEKAPNSNVPKLVVECIRLIEKNLEFMNTFGLYRVSGNYSTIQKLRFNINSNNYSSLEKQKEPHEITGILKLFLRELKDPLLSMQEINAHIPENHIFEMLEKKEKIERVKNLVQSLEGTKRDTLRVIMQHLRKVADNEMNQMNANSLSVVMGSCIYYETSTDICPEKLMTLSLVPNLSLQLMIENVETIFMRTEEPIEASNASPRPKTHKYL